MSEIPARYAPELPSDAFLVSPKARPEERIAVGVLFVGAGPAGLAGAIRLAQRLTRAPEMRERLGEIPIAVVEKGKYPGAHLVSGAIVNPRAFRELFPQLSPTELPFRGPVEQEALYLLTRRRAFRVPPPPTMRNHEYHVASISEIARWLAQQAEALGVTLLNETAAVKALVEGGAVRGVLTGDKGRGPDGTPMQTFEPGVEIVAKVTVLAEGSAGHLTDALVRRYDLAGANPQTYALGVKEIWNVPVRLDRVIHTMGWPLRSVGSRAEFGGSFVYPLGDQQVSIGLVVGLDYTDATLSVHDLLQELKLHPLIRRILAGGVRAENGWGAKTIPEGGFYAVPRRLSVPGALLCGDSAGFVNVPTLKGIHYAMESGILAADAIFATLEAGRDPAAPGSLECYDGAVRQSFIWDELRRVRNMRQAFRAGLAPGVLLAGLMMLTRGAFPGWRLRTEADARRPVSMGGRTYPKPDRKLTFDKLSSVHASGNRTRDAVPNHLVVAREVPEAVGETWIHMCPAAVYEWTTDERGHRTIRMNPSNCVQCGAISAKGGRLTPPEGGSGPEYLVT